MRKIKITNEVTRIAEDYFNEMRSKPHFTNVNIDPWDRLIALKNEINDISTKMYYEKKLIGKIKKIRIINKSPYIQYIDKILTLLNFDLLNCPPSRFQSLVTDFEAIISKNDLQLKIVIGKDKNGKAKTFSEILVDKMLYGKVRHFVFPKYVRRLNVKSCVYCNAAYAVTDEVHRAYYDLDHWMPKSLYPYLCISFFNLQPSCPVCNRTKSNDDQTEFFCLYEEDITINLDVFNLDLDELSIARYLLSHHSEQLTIRLTAAKQEYVTMCNNMDAKLHITSLYTEHKDVAEEVIWKRLAFDSGYLRLAKLSFGGFAPTPSDVSRFIIGTYGNLDEIHKRPMTQLIQGIAKQMGIL